MNLKHVGLGVSNIVVALLTAPFAVLMMWNGFENILFGPFDGFLSALFGGLGVVIFTVGFLLLILAHLVSAVGWFTDRLSRTRLHRVSRVGVVSGVLIWVGIQLALFSWDLFNFFAPAVLCGVMILPFVFGARLTRPEQPPTADTDEVGGERGRPSA